MAFNFKKQGRKMRQIGSLALKKSKEPKKIIYPIVFILVITLLVAVYIGLKSYKTSLGRKLKNINNEIEAIKKEKATALKGEIDAFQKKVSSLKILLDNHLYWTNLFQFIQDITLPKTQFTNFQANVENYQLALDGVTPTLASLAQQLKFLKESKLLEEVKLTNLSLEEEGVKFGLSLKISPKVWEKELQENES